MARTIASRIGRVVHSARAQLDRVVCSARTQVGQGLVEYALIIALVSIAVILLLTLLGNQVGKVFSQISSTLSTA